MLTENKHVSVLFVDVCDSTSLLQHADPEEFRDYLGEALDLAIDAVKFVAFITATRSLQLFSKMHQSRSLFVTQF